MIRLVTIALVICFACSTSACSSLDEGQQKEISNANKGEAAESGGKYDLADRPEWWPEDGLATRLPFPSSQTGEVLNDTDDYFQAEVKKSTEGDYAAYIEACKTAGFTLESLETASSYEAYSEDGYRLRVYPHFSEQFYVVNLDAPLNLGVLTWPTTEPGSLLPPPESQAGLVDIDGSSAFGAYVGKMSQDEFNVYIDVCSEAGFSVDCSRTDRMYTADDASGNHLKIEYFGYDTIYVYVTLAEN